MKLEQRIDHAYDDLLTQLPSIREGNADAVHDARVAARRLRTIVAVLDGDGSADRWKAIDKTMKRAGRALGKVRDIDVEISLLAELERRAPGVAAAAAAHRARLLPVQAAAHRKLIKRLEKTLSSSPKLPSPVRTRLLARSASQHDSGLLVEALAERARDTLHRMEHGTGVYFARRAHNLRASLRKLRYILELSDESDERRRAMKTLRRAQDTLGRIHDRQVLHDDVLGAVRYDETLEQSSTTLLAVLEAECRTLFERYRAARAEIAELCVAILRWSASQRLGRRRRRMMTIGAIALPSAALLLAPRLSRRVPA